MHEYGVLFFFFISVHRDRSYIKRKTADFAGDNGNTLTAYYTETGRRRCGTYVKKGVKTI